MKKTKEIPSSFYAFALIVNEKDEILIGQRTDNGIWTTPGGGNNPGETPKDTIKRELFEETGLALYDFYEMQSSLTPNGKPVFYFQARVNPNDKYLDQLTAKMDPDKEVKEWIWIHPKDMTEDMKKDELRYKFMMDGYKFCLGVVYKAECSEYAELTNVLLFKGKKVGVGTVSGDYKKVAEGKWVKVPLNGHKTEGAKPTESTTPKELNAQEHQKQANVHFDEATKYANFLGKLNEKIAVKRKVDKTYKVPEKAQKLVNEVQAKIKFHTKAFKEHRAQGAQNWKQGVATGEQANKYQAQRANEAQHKIDQSKLTQKMNKSMVSVDQQGTALETGNFAMEKQASDKYWLNKFYEAMTDFQFGDVPKEISLSNDYRIFLAKVDDGLYSGYIRKMDSTSLSDYSENGTINRVEKQTIPAIIQFLTAKEYISLMQIEPTALHQALSSQPEPQAIVVTPVNETTYSGNSLIVKLIDLLNKLS